MLSKIDRVYKLICNEFKFRIDNNNLSVVTKKNISNEYRESAKTFIADNKDFIISILKGNLDLSNILHFNLANVPVPLAYAQERLWFVEKYEGGTNAYNVSLIYKLSRETKLEVLKQSIRGIVSRHEVLRTLIQEDSEGNGYQLVLDDKESPLQISHRKVSSLSELDEELRAEVNRIYDLSKEYPIRVCIYELSGAIKEDT